MSGDGSLLTVASFGDPTFGLFDLSHPARPRPAGHAVATLRAEGEEQHRLSGARVRNADETDVTWVGSVGIMIAFDLGAGYLAGGLSRGVRGLGGALRCCS